MGTRGLCGFRVNERDYLTYNHFDSYPSCLGEAVLAFTRDMLQRDAVLETAVRVVALRLVDEHTPASPEDQARCATVADFSVAGGAPTDWYCLLRQAQGKLGAYLDVGVMIDSHEFARDSLFCEWAYIVNFDEQTLEVYRGFQEQPHAAGRYADHGPKRPPVAGATYYPIALVAVYAWGDLPSRLDEDVLHEAPPLELDAVT